MVKRGSRKGNWAKDSPFVTAMEGDTSIHYVNVTLDREDILQDAMRVISVIRPEWTLREMITQTFSEGYMNCMMAFSQSSDKDRTDAIILRVYGSLNNVYNTFSREREFHTMQIAHAAGIFPELLAVFDNGVAYKFFPGEPLKHEHFFDSNIIKTVTHKLASLHSKDPASLSLLSCTGVLSDFDRQPNLRPRVAHCTDIMPEHLLDSEKDKRYQELRMSKEELLTSFDAMDSVLRELGLPMCVSHGDFHLKNAVYDSRTGDVILVDYEMSGIQYEATDLAYIFSFRPCQDMLGMLRPSDPVITPEVRTQWIRAYLQSKYELQGRGSADIPEVLLQLSDVEHQLVEIFLCLLYITLIQMSTEFATIFPGDHLGALSIVKSKWEQGQKDMDHLKQKYTELNKECQRQNLL